MDEVVIPVLLATNAAFAAVFAPLLARHLAAVRPGGRFLPWLLALWGIYLAEGAAFSASMATNVLNFALAAVWGVVFARKLRHLPRRQRVASSLRVGLYTSLPAVSFASVLVVMAAGGWPILTAKGGHDFGVPEFVPWPFCTMLGFFAAVVGSAVVGKTLITTAIAASKRGATGAAA